VTSQVSQPGMNGRSGPRILAVRLGAMGDIIHALPAVATLKHSFPRCHLCWVVEPRWAPLLDGNPFVDEVVLFNRGSLRGLLETRRRLRAGRFDVAVDFQGLLKSALVASAARPEKIIGYHPAEAREPLAALFYSTKVRPRSLHIVDRHLELAAAAGATNLLKSFPLPPGAPEGELPEGPFVLASPLAGWVSKQWPAESYAALGRMLRERLGIPLVLNAPPGDAASLAGIPDTIPHTSGLPGLIHATRRAAAVVGVDSGPLHLAAALGKPGVAILGPTDPARNGPYGGSIKTLRSPSARVSYKRRTAIDPSMREITPEMVMEALQEPLAALRTSAGGVS
jgi:heptosyltransferase-1